MATLERFVASANIERFDDTDFELTGVAAGAGVTDEKTPPHEFPRISLSKEDRDEISIYLQEMYHSMKSERAEYSDVVSEIRKLYEMTELAESKDFPFENSAHLIIPLIATYTETIWAKLVNTIFAPSDPFATKPTKGKITTTDGREIDMNKAAKAVRKFLTLVCREELKLKQFFTRFALDLIAEGTAYSKTIYSVEDRMVRQYNPRTRAFDKISIRVKDHPEVLHIPFDDLLYPITTKDLADAEIVMHRYPLSERQLDAVAEREDWDDLDKLKAHIAKKRTAAETDEDDAMGVNPQTHDAVDMVECWFSHTLRGKEGDKDTPVALKAQFHPDSGIIARIEHNTYPLQKHPFDAAAYIPRPHRVPGIGVGHMVLPFQKEISTMHNQRLDAATLANAHVTLIKDDGTLPLDLKLKPGSTLAVSDPKEISNFALGSKFDSTINEEKHTLEMVQNRVGLQDFQNMQANGTSTQVILNMQELTRKFDIIVGGSREFLERVAEKVMLLYQQHYPDGKPVMMMGDDGDFIEEIFDLPQIQILNGIGISVTATTSVTSKDLERQSKLALLNALGAYQDKVANYAQLLANPQAPPQLRTVVSKIVNGLSAFVDDLLEDFNITYKDEIIIGPADIGIGEPPLPPVIPGVEQAPEGGGPGAPGEPGMADLQQILASAGGPGA